MWAVADDSVVQQWRQRRGRGVTAFRTNYFRSTAKLEFDALLELIRLKQ